jgi:hypothetical protein
VPDVVNRFLLEKWQHVARGRQRLADHRQDHPVQPRLARNSGANVAPMAVNATHPDVASQARHELVARVETFASRNVVDAARYARQ